jgi:tetratricopeptide (TPR) repeat protein
MGSIYLARREDEFDKVVALKIIKRGMDTDDMLRRFRNERQILAHLDHPNIARLLDGGTTEDGLPYFVMEHVDGMCIDDYCDKHHLTINDRLKLFRQVCTAVNYAHQRLAIHRDIKPSNILVTVDGTPKLLDFGIAKLLIPNATGAETLTGMQLMTPEYASPEQARGDGTITTASDIYSLGVVLFELLTGESPYKFPSRRADEVARVICETYPERPSRVNNPTTTPVINNRQLRGDLDNILLMALRKDPARRYSSVEQFSEDIRRHLEGLPVIARADTLRYRTSKFIIRHRAASLAALLFAATLIAGIAATLYQAREANRERALAERRFSEVRQLANSVVFKYHDAIAALPGSTQVREMLVKDALQYLDNLARDSSGDRSLQRELALAYLKVGNVQGRVYEANLGNVKGAISSYRKALVLCEALAEAKSDVQAQIDLRDAYQTLALTTANGGDPDAVLFIDKAIKLSEQLAATNPNDSTNQLMLARSYVLRMDTRSLPVEGRFAGQQLVEQHAQAVDVAARVDVQPAHLRLLGAHVERRADHLLELRINRLLDQPSLRRLGHAKVDHLRHRLPVVDRDEDVRRLQIAVDDGFLVRVLHALTDEEEQVEPFAYREPMAVAVLRDRHALDVLHDEVGPACVGQPAVEHLGDVGVVHERQRFALGGKPGEARKSTVSNSGAARCGVSGDGTLLIGLAQGNAVALQHAIERAAIDAQCGGRVTHVAEPRHRFLDRTPVGMVRPGHGCAHGGRWSVQLHRQHHR